MASKLHDNKTFLGEGAGPPSPLDPLVKIVLSKKYIYEKDFTTKVHGHKVGHWNFTPFIHAFICALLCRFRPSTSKIQCMLHLHLQRKAVFSEVSFSQLRAQMRMQEFFFWEEAVLMMKIFSWNTISYILRSNSPKLKFFHPCGCAHLPAVRTSKGVFFFFFFFFIFGGGGILFVCLFFLQKRNKMSMRRMLIAFAESDQRSVRGWAECHKRGNTCTHLLFWNQVLICVSVRPRFCDSSILLLTLRYLSFWEENQMFFWNYCYYFIFVAICDFSSRLFRLAPC